MAKPTLLCHAVKGETVATIIGGNIRITRTIRYTTGNAVGQDRGVGD